MSEKPGVIFLRDGKPVEVPCEAKYVSDGSHCFDELYEHRCLLFIALMRSHPRMCWRALRHNDGSFHEGWFVAGMDLIPGVFYEDHLIYSKHNLGDRPSGSVLGSFRLSIIDRDLTSVSWHKTSAGYIHRQPHLPNPNGYLHRIVAKRMFGDIPKGYEVDHINRHQDDCSRFNLRLATSKGQKLNTSRSGGSVFQRKNGRWGAKFGGNPQVHLGTHDTQDQAINACIEYHRSLIDQAEKNGDFVYYKPSSISITYHLPERLWHLLHGIEEKKVAPPWDGHTPSDVLERLENWILQGTI